MANIQTYNTTPVDPGQNNGLITKIWGPPTWTSAHCISFGYPIKPSEEQKKTYKVFFRALGDVLPCRYCRESYRKFISSGEAEMTDDVFNSRQSLTKWFYVLHNQVNKKLGVDYCVNYEDIVHRYESYRARCVHEDMPKNEPKGCLKPLYSQPYKMVGDKDAPVIPFKIATVFIPLLRRRKISIPVNFTNIKSQNDLDMMMVNKRSEGWINRNKECCKIITTMRKDNTQPTIQDGTMKGFPTDDELKLISMYSSNLSVDKLKQLGDAIEGRKNYYYLKK